MAISYDYMTGDEYRRIIAKLGYNISTFGKFMRFGVRTSFRYADDGAGITSPLADLMRAMAAGKVTPAQLEALRLKNEKGRSNGKRHRR